MKTRIVLTFAALAAATLAACSSGTQITVSDEHARIYVNGDYVGTGDGYYSDRRPAFTTQQVTLHRPGCQEQSHTMTRNEKPHYGAIISAAYLALPILWVTKYKDQHAYEYVCLDEVD
jgi:hypothetical protein